MDKREVVIPQEEEVESFDKTMARLKLLMEEKERERKAMDIRIKELLVKYEQEKKDRLAKAIEQRKEIYLEAIWIYKDAGLVDRQKACSLIKKNDVKKDIPNIMRESDIYEDRQKLCGQTAWSKRKSRDIKGYEEGLWIRGEREAVRNTIKASWEDIRESGFTKDKDKTKNPENISEEINELNDFCTVNKVGQLTEVKCLHKTVPSPRKIFSR